HCNATPDHYRDLDGYAHTHTLAATICRNRYYCVRRCFFAVRSAYACSHIYTNGNPNSYRVYSTSSPTIQPGRGDRWRSVDLLVTSATRWYAGKRQPSLAH